MIMRLKTTNSKHKTHFSIINDCTRNGKRTTKVIENLGNIDDVTKRAGNEDYNVWLKNYIDELNAQQLKEPEALIKLSPKKELPKDKQSTFNAGYLFLQDIYYKLGLHNICDRITEQYQFKFNLNDILSKLIYSRIIYPKSKLSTLESSKRFVEQPKFELQHIYRALEVIAKENDFIQSELYKNSLKLSKRNTGILYYDCTNYFFEIEQADGLKQYGKSKENKPTPIVQMGLFMDGDGIPLAFDITAGNTNEQVTLKPLEKQIIKDFELSKFVVVTDAGLASNANRKFNNEQGRAFITTQSVKKLKNHLMDWALDPDDWSLPNINRRFNISELSDEDLYKDKIFYKERWINENDLEQRLIVTYSIKYRDYHKNIRKGQIERAEKLINQSPTKLGKVNQNDFKRFILKTSITSDGEVAEDTLYQIDDSLINKESKFDGFYAVCTNLEDDISEIVRVNRRRWEIEESFRIMKSEFEARPVYLQRDDRIKAHFTTCVLALIIYRYLEKRLDEKYTVTEIINCLRNYNFVYHEGSGYSPCYTRTDFTDTLHDKFGFNTSFEIVTEKSFKNICKQTTR